MDILFHRFPINIKEGGGQEKTGYFPVSWGMLKISRHEEISNLLKSGLSYAEIGRRWNISRQRVWQIANKNPQNVTGPKLMLTTGDVARRLGIPANTVRYWADKGILKSSRIGPRGDRRFKFDDIAGFKKKH